MFKISGNVNKIFTKKITENSSMHKKGPKYARKYFQIQSSALQMREK